MEVLLPPVARLSPSQQNLSFGRINVILGINGSGKSTYLRTLIGLLEKAHPDKKPLYIEGGRVAEVPSAARIPFQIRDQHGIKTTEFYVKQYDTSRKSTMKSRIQHALYLLSAREIALKQKDYEALDTWRQLPEKTLDGIPVQPQGYFTRLFTMFQSVFPAITLERDANDNIWASQDSPKYPLAQLSDGERQVLSLLLDLLLSAGDANVIVVDEPELNLHTSLAIDLWRQIEKGQADSVFVYATHNAAFAARAGVDKVFHISKSKHLVPISGYQDLSAEERRSFLGIVPGVLTNDKVLFCEGGEDSVDCRFYRWLLSGAGVAVKPVGYHKDVLRVTKDTSVLGQLAPGVQVCGVVDRDYYPDGTLQAFRRDVFVLPFHEVESYLCHPSVILELSDAQDRDGLNRDYMSRFFELASKAAADTASYRASQRKDKDPKNLLRIVQEEQARIETEIAQGNVEGALCLVPGKEILPGLVGLVGLERSEQVIERLVSGHDPATISLLVDLREALLGRMKVLSA